MTRKALSSYWAASHHRALGTTTDEAIRLAIALGAVKSIVRVVDRTVPPLSVDWASVDDKALVKSMSYTDFTGHAIRINPMPIKDTSLDPGQALDIATGFGLHEASHSQESRDRYKYLVKKEPGPGIFGDPEYLRREREVPAFEPMRIAAYLWNLVEDVRIEHVTSGHWPGFAPYFEAVLDYMWLEMRKRHDLPTEYKPDIASRVLTAWLACRYPVQFSPSDPALVAEIAWWQAWQHDYLAETTDTPTTIRRGLDHLAEDAETAKEMEEQRASEQAEREAGERVRAQIERLIREGIEGAFGTCAMGDGPIIPLDAETAETVRRLVREGLVEHRVVVTHEGAAVPQVYVRKPTETPESKRAYVGKPDAEAEALRAALVFRASAPQYDAKLLKAGQIDDEELYRWGLGDNRVFSERVVDAKPDVFMGLLVDMSGSMSGHKLDIAQRLAQLFVWAVHDQEGIETAVWGHTADTGYVSSAEVYRLWEKGDPMSRLGLIEELAHANNHDGAAIEYVASQVAQAEQPEKVLVVLSDGLPSAEGYGGKPAQQHIRSVVRWAASRGVRVMQVAIDSDNLRPEAQAAMFGTDWIGFTGYATLPRQIATLLGRFM